jgi:hypothetical protein
MKGLLGQCRVPGAEFRGQFTLPSSRVRGRVPGTQKQESGVPGTVPAGAIRGQFGAIPGTQSRRNPGAAQFRAQRNQRNSGDSLLSAIPGTAIPGTGNSGDSLLNSRYSAGCARKSSEYGGMLEYLRIGGRPRLIPLACLAAIFSTSRDQLSVVYQNISQYLRCLRTSRSTRLRVTRRRTSPSRLPT